MGTDVVARGSGLRLAFRIVAGVFGLLGLVFSVPFAVASFIDEQEKIHLVHNLGGLAVYGVLIGAGLLLLAARPEANIATYQGLAIAAVGALAGGVLGGDLVEGFWFGPAVIVLILFLLHPRRGELLRAGRPSAGPFILSALAAVPLVAYALTQARLQAEGVTANPHVEFHHYSGQAAGSLMLVLFALAPGLGSRGWRAAGWLTGFAMAVIAVASLVYGDRESALDVLWAWLALAWAVAYVAVVEVRARKASA